MKGSKLRLLVILLISVFISSCWGQSKIDDKQETSNITEPPDQVSELDNRIWVVFQDSKGNYWFGSNGKGLYRFDGKQLDLFTSRHGLVDNTIRGIQEDHSGNIFIETPNGISKYDGKVFSTLEIESSLTNEWKLEENDLWFGYNANDLYRYDGKKLFTLMLPRKDLKKAFGMNVTGVPFEAKNQHSPYAVFGVDKDNEGNIWFGTGTAGAFRFDGKSFLWFAEKELSILPDGRVPGVRSMIQDKDGDFWLSNLRTKYRIDTTLAKGYAKFPAAPNSDEILGDKIGYFNSGLADQNGNLWMTTYGGRVWKYDGKTLSNIEITNETEEVLLISIFQDNKGAIWLGTDNDGVYVQNGERFEKFSPSSSNYPKIRKQNEAKE